ncbi:MAG TPA: hypothetical protein VIL49_04965 [Capillimicrobium sp.]|jgi:hypothetical protein
MLTAALIGLALAGGGSDPASGIQIVKPVDGVRGGKVTVGVDIADAQSKAADRKARPRVVARVVRTLVDEGAQRPMRVSGFRCTPTVTGPGGVKVAWRCAYGGGAVELDFSYRLTS